MDPPPDAIPHEEPGLDAEIGEHDDTTLEAGYTLTLTVQPDGTFRVGRPTPLAGAAALPTEALIEGPSTEAAGEEFPTLTEALKAVMRTVVAHPLAGTEQAAFESGFSDGGMHQGNPVPPRDEGY